jgi:hypothetical protein
MYPNANIWINGEVYVDRKSTRLVLGLHLAGCENHSPDLSDVKISLMFGVYKKDSNEMISWATMKDWTGDLYNEDVILISPYKYVDDKIVPEDCQHQIQNGVSLSPYKCIDDKISPEDCLYQIQLVVTIPKKSRSTWTRDVLQMFSHTDFSDVTIVCGEEEEEEQFKCHKIILAVRSRVFSAMFNMVESSEFQTGVVKVDDINAKTMKSLLKYIYQDQVEEEDMDSDLILAADKYELPDLVSQCKTTFVYHMSNDNILGILIASTLLNLKDIIELAMRRIRRWTDIKDEDQWNSFKSENPDLAKEIEHSWILEEADETYSDYDF